MKTRAYHIEQAELALARAHARAEELHNSGERLISVAQFEQDTVSLLVAFSLAHSTLANLAAP